MHALSTPTPPERLVEQPSTETVDLGIVEGYFGRPWSWAEREATMVFLAYPLAVRVSEAFGG